MNAHELVKAGHLMDAIGILEEELKREPRNRPNRISLFELNCFNGDFDRGLVLLRELLAEPGSNEDSDLPHYIPVIQAERKRQAAFVSHSYPRPLVDGGVTAFTGTLNGREFMMLNDADSRIGSHLEIFSGAEYFWISLSDVRRLRLPAPRRLRDLLWLPVQISVVSTLERPQLPDAWIPMMTPLTWEHRDEEVRLGRISEWDHNEFGEFVPFGIKSFVVDDQEIPLADIREIEIRSVLSAAYPAVTN